jgi:hypothetical protein
LIQNRTNLIRAIDADPVFELAKGPKNISRGEGSRLTVWKERERGFLERVLEERDRLRIRRDRPEQASVVRGNYYNIPIRETGRE